MPQWTYAVKNTFVTVRRPAAQRRRSCPPVLVAVAPRTKVMLANLPIRATPAPVLAHLAALGAAVLDLVLPIDRKTGLNKGYAFLKFETEAGAEACIAAVAGTQLQGSHSQKLLAAAFARAPPRRK